MSESIYLDYAAATPCDARVFKAMEPFFSENFYNPSAPYGPAREVRSSYESAKRDIAQVLGAKPDEIVMTAGATESIYMAFGGLLQKGSHCVIGATEHAAVRAAAGQYDSSFAKSTKKGIITPEAVAAAVRDDTVLVSVTAADSELGVVQPLRAIAKKLSDIKQDRRERGIKTPLFFHSDASQAAGFLDIHVSRLGVDMMTLNASKCYGPKQTGLLWVSSRVPLISIMAGGGQERGLRGGTENVAGAVGFSVALNYAQRRRHNEAERLSALRDMLQRGLEDLFPEMIVNGHEKKRLPGHLNISIPGLDAERVVFRLDMGGVYVATGAACAANKGTRSTVLDAIGLDDETADGSLRISLGRFTTKDQIEKVIPLIAEAIKVESAL